MEELNLNAMVAEKNIPEPISSLREVKILLGSHIFKINYKRVNDRKARITDISILKINNGVGDMDFKVSISKTYIKNSVKEDIRNCEKVTIDKRVDKILDDLKIPDYLEYLDKA